MDVRAWQSRARACPPLDAAGNLVRPLVHGATYFAGWSTRCEALGRGRPAALHRLARRPRRAAAPDGPDASREAVRRRPPSAGSCVRGLVWRSHLRPAAVLRRGEPAARRARSNDGGGEVLLDMRVRPGGRTTRSSSSCGTRAGPSATSPSSAASTCATAAATTPTTRGDPQAQPMAEVYGPRPPWHDVQLDDPRARPSATSRRCSGSAGRTRQPLDPPPVAGSADRLHRDRTGSAGPLPPQLPRPARARAARRCSCCAPTRTGAPATRSRPTASAASPAATPRRCGGPAG